MDAMEPRVGAVGHSHVALFFHRNGRGAVARRAGARAAPSSTCPTGELAASTPAASGQPRDGDPRAAWLLLDTGQLDRRVAARGVPDRRGRQGDRGGRPAAVLAERLYTGQ